MRPETRRKVRVSRLLPQGDDGVGDGLDFGIDPMNGVRGENA